MHSRLAPQKKANPSEKAVLALALSGRGRPDEDGG